MWLKWHKYAASVLVIVNELKLLFTHVTFNSGQNAATKVSNKVCRFHLIQSHCSQYRPEMSSEMFQLGVDTLHTSA